MHGEINIHAQVAIVTKAKLDAISVGGECHCGEAEPVITDYVVVIDGSDSYNNKVTMSSGQTVESEAFDQTKKWCAGLFKNLAGAKNAGMTTVSLVQFSGIKPLEGSYKPGAQGETGNPGLYHYRVQVAPTAVGNLRDINDKCTNFDALDGNGQLFLCLQDLAMPWFTGQFQKALPGAKRETVIIVVSDEEWDVKKLQNAFGSGNATADSVCAAVHKAYSQLFAVVVRPNRFNDQNEDFIKNQLCNGKSANYIKVYTDKFEDMMNDAGKNICSKLGYTVDGRFF